MGLKQFVFDAAARAGGFAAARDSAWRSARLMILCYHGISMDDEHAWRPTLYMAPARFRERMQLLRARGYAVLPLDEAVRRLYDGTLPPRSVALTFDDGAVDFAERALPILREFDAPATVYLTTYYCGRPEPVFDTGVSYVLWKGRASGADVADLVGVPGPLPLADEAGRAAAIAAVRDHAAAAGMPADEKFALWRRLAERVGVDADALVARRTLQIMTPDEVRALPRDLVDVQLHTHRHRTPVDEALFTREIRDNAAAIRAILPDARPLDHFCYPSGIYRGAFLPWLRAEGVRYATTCVPGLAAASAEPLRLPRGVAADTQPLAAFEAWVSGFAGMLPRSREHRLDPARLAGAGA